MRTLTLLRTPRNAAPQPARLTPISFVPTLTVTLLTIASLTIASIAGLPSLANAQDNFPVMGNTPDFREELLELVNAARKRAGVPPLKLNAKLNRAAQNHTDDMAVRNYLALVSPQGSTIEKRLQTVSYRYRTVGQMIDAVTPPTPNRAKAVFEGWMATPKTRNMLLDSKYREMGAGRSPGKNSSAACKNPANVDCIELQLFTPAEPPIHYWSQVLAAPQ